MYTGGTEPAKAPETAKEFTDCYILERLFSTSLVVLVSIQFPRKLKVYHFKKGSEICNYSYSNTILSVKLNRYRLVVCLEENLHIHNLKDMKCLHTIRDTPPNPNGLMALSADENCYIAYPVSCSAGEVQIFDGKNLQNKLMIPAHNSPLAAMAFDNSGRMLATASEKGTVIRVFSLADSTKLFELRRGVIRNASIYSLTFSCNDKYLCTSSNTETVHIFKLDHQAEPPPDDGGYWSFMGRVFREGANMLPYPMTEMWKQERSFATALVPSSQCRKVATIASIGGETRVLVATEDGYLYIFNLDTYMGGVCSLERTHK
ncbi:WIPI2 [Cordylochernes scorpioides]|uniref:WIPI2 n=1 Tax=Cordylochernes scorpioides TaxID=51811 RepID=A0ABY6K186_9ARAC|nr:WIPI2 [Cordylochernes scorpioides]